MPYLNDCSNHWIFDAAIDLAKSSWRGSFKVFLGRGVTPEGA